jgi:HlyD family secretion protein
MSTIAFPTSAPTRIQSKRWVMWVVASLVTSLALATYWLSTRSVHSSALITTGKFYTLSPVDLDVKVKKDGELQAVNNIEIVCLVEGLNTLTQIVKEGSFVKKGDVLVTIDSSVIRQKIDDTEIDLQKAKSDVETSQQMLEIQKSQNAANLEAAQVNLELSQIALRQYKEGLFPQQLADAQTAVQMAELSLKSKEDDLRNTLALLARGFVTEADRKQADLSVTTCRNDLSKAQTTLKVLSDYSHQMDEKGKESYVEQCKQSLARTQKENLINLQQRKVDLETKQAALLIVQRKYEHLKEQLDDCTIKAPADGLVVYAQNERSSQQPIEEGTQVRERQQLLRLPDTSAMKAIVRINESQVTQLRPGQRALVWITGVPEPVGATVEKISPVVDSSQRWWNPDLREYPVELTLDNTPANLKPGISARGEIYVDRLEHVLAVPLAALYSEKSTSYVFARNGEEIKPIPVKLGAINEVQAQILDGISPGDQVLLLEAGQGRELLEKAGLHSEESSSDHTKGPGAAPAKRRPDSHDADKSKNDAVTPHLQEK